MKIKKLNENWMAEKPRGRYSMNFEERLYQIFHEVKNHVSIDLRDIKEMMVSYEEDVELNHGAEEREDIIWNKEERNKSQKL